MVDINIDTVEFKLKEYHDFSWLNSLGNVFCVFSRNDSGNISFGIDNGHERYFIKVAGLKTAESVRTSEEAVTTLKKAMPIYEDIIHPNLIELVEHYPLGETYVAVFKWVEGECLFDHWNFEKYSNNPNIKPPSLKFKELPIEKRLKSIDTLFSFLIAAANKGYVAVDFYDGSIIYDFNTNTTTICDIDFFRKSPTINDIGENFFGTKRLKAPEEYIYDATIDEITNVYTIGALIFNFFGSYTNTDINQMYKNKAFFPCLFEKWELGKECYEIALRAVALNRDKRYNSISEFFLEWNNALLA